MKPAPLRFALLFVLAATLGPAPQTAAAPADEEATIQGKPLGYWVEQLKEDHVLAREESLEVLAQAGAAAKPALPAVRALLKDQPLTVRFRAAVAVWKIGGDPAPAVPVLTDALAGPDRGLRLRAVQELGALGPAAESAAPALVQRLADKDDAVRRDAASALQQIGTAAVAALAKGAAPDSAVRRESIDLLARLGSRASDAVPALMAALKDDDPKLRTAAAAALWRVDPTNAAGVPVLVEGFTSTDLAVRRQAMETLFAMRPRPKEAAATFAAALKGNDIVTRVRAADAAWDLNGKPDEVLPTLTEAVKSNDLNIRGPALETLRRMGPKAKPALPVLVELFATPNIATPQFVEAVLALGPDATAAAAKALEEKPAVAKQNAASVLGAVGADGVEPLRKLAGHDDALVRTHAVRALGQIGPAAADKVAAALAEALKDKDRNVRLTALTSYRQLSPATDAPAVLLELAQDKDVAVRVNAMNGLERLRLDPKTALPVLEEVAAKDDNAFQRARAAELCWRLDPKKHPAADVVKELLKVNQHLRAADFVARAGDRDALPALADGLPNQQPFIRQRILDTIAGFGADAKAVRPALVEAMKDPQAVVRVSAALALLQSGDAEAALPVLAAALKDNTVHITYHERIHAALRKLGPDAKAALPGLKSVAGEPGVTLYRIQCLVTMAKVDPAEKDAAVATLTELLGRTTSYFQIEVAAALLQLEPDNRRALMVLEQALSDANRQVAARALLRLGPAAKAAAPALRRATEDESVLVRYMAAAAWWKVDGKNPKAFAVLTDALKDRTAPADARTQAALALGELGEDARDAAPVLLEALRDRNPTVRAVAETALKKVDPEAARKAGY
jgi:HEAT repeat protein